MKHYRRKTHRRRRGHRGRGKLDLLKRVGKVALNLALSSKYGRDSVQRLVNYQKTL